LPLQIFVYDTKTNTFGRALGTSTHDPGLILPGCGPFPINNNLPQANVLGSKIFAMGGECDGVSVHGEAYGHYPPLALLGEIGALKVRRSRCWWRCCCCCRCW
jgi:hypothetical protein